MRLIYLFLALVIIAGCARTAPETIDPPAIPGAACSQDSDCLPCGDGCISAEIAPVAECAVPTHDSCVCRDAACVRE